MTDFIILVAELIGLYLLARLATKKLFTFFLLIFPSRSVAVTLVTLILFPGTVIHELSHLFTAEILGVRTGKLTLVPENIREDDRAYGGQEIQTGSVTVAQTDPFRRALVGLAPFLVGLSALVVISYFLRNQVTWLNLKQSNNLGLLAVLLFYLIFTIASSMFPSAPDLKGTPALMLTLLLFALAGYVVGVRVGLTGQALVVTERILTGLVQSLGLVLAINVALLLILNVLVVLTSKITHRRLLS